MTNLSIYVKMSNVMLALSVFLLLNSYWLEDYYYYGKSVNINYPYEAVGILMPMALCCLVTAFILLHCSSYLTRYGTNLKGLAAVGCLIGGRTIIMS